MLMTSRKISELHARSGKQVGGQESRSADLNFRRPKNCVGDEQLVDFSKNCASWKISGQPEQLVGDQ